MLLSADDTTMNAEDATMCDYVRQRCDQDVTICAQDATLCAKDATMCAKDGTMKDKEARGAEPPGFREICTSDFRTKSTRIISEDFRGQYRELPQLLRAPGGRPIPAPPTPN